ncbi:ModD protein [Martelella alba]|uniref:Putative pyrophosphorylase ModD n=1 Tax=Martelella alba TaxID=2590451 RepID=A0ABY2SMX8_9HYPH|nr:ModD protein [Martelella alba]TKI07240.1 ModD protein [Martelella alba]
MIYLSDHELDCLLLEDVRYGDITTRALGIGGQHGTMAFARRRAGKISGVAVAARLLARLALQVDVRSVDGGLAADGETLLTATGTAEKLHQGWKAAQNILEWCCGVAHATHELVSRAQKINGEMRIACTRKTIPGTKNLALATVLDGGGTLHRVGTADSLMLFTNHRRFRADPADWRGHILTLRRNAPDRLIAVEADNEREAEAALRAKPDMLQLDKFSPTAVSKILALAAACAPDCRIAVAGGINVDNIAEYAATGVRLAVTSMPYYAQPADIKVTLQPV